ncbi:MAG: hypothetical protein LC750_00575 [Actinobacteria bacterium]|nr:hypothetical protein [Actinomycetota bacterium]
MPKHEQNGGRQYLADAVNAQGTRIDAVSDKVADIDKRVAGQTVSLATLIESDHRAREHRDKIWSAINAMRAEQQQIVLAQTGMPGAIDRLAAAVEGQGKKLSEIETDRQQAKGAWNLATASARLAWGVVAGIVLALAAGAVTLWRVISNLPPSTPTGGHP